MVTLRAYLEALRSTKQNDTNSKTRNLNSFQIRTSTNKHIVLIITQLENPPP